MGAGGRPTFVNASLTCQLGATRIGPLSGKREALVIVRRERVRLGHGFFYSRINTLGCGSMWRGSVNRSVTQAMSGEGEPMLMSEEGESG